MQIKRIFHTWDEWECYPAGFYETKPPNGMTDEEALEAYRDFLADLPAFDEALKKVTTEWVNSCEHYLTNERMNRIAWLGQASACYALGLPRHYRAGYHKLTERQQREADELALVYLNKWLDANGQGQLTLLTAQSKTRMDLY